MELTLLRAPERRLMERANSRLVIRWIDSAQARRYIQDDQIRPSWKHFVPELGKMRTGICFDLMTTANWRSGHKRIGVLIETANLPENVKSHAIDGHKVFCLSEHLLCEPPEQQRKQAKEAKAQAHLYSEHADKLFVTGTIDKLGSRLSGIVLLETGKKWGAKLEVEMREFCETNHLPVLNMTPNQFGCARVCESGVARALAAQTAKLKIHFMQSDLKPSGTAGSGSFRS